MPRPAASSGGWLRGPQPDSDPSQYFRPVAEQPPSDEGQPQLNGAFFATWHPTLQLMVEVNTRIGALARSQAPSLSCSPILVVRGTTNP
jgi:hypothetical protein